MAASKRDPKKRTASTQTGLKPRIKVWIEFDGSYAFGPGMCQILQAVERTGSIKQAASEVGLSYRHVWDRIKEAERAGGFTLVSSQLGGKDSRRSDITEEAKQLVDGFLAIRSRMIELMDLEFVHHFPKHAKHSTAK